MNFWSQNLTWTYYQCQEPSISAHFNRSLTVELKINTCVMALVVVTIMKFNLGIKGHFTLKWRSPTVMNSRGISEFDWSWATLLSGGGLHCGQESFGGEHCTGMKKMSWMSMWWHFFWRGVLRRSGFLGNPKASYKKLDLWRTRTYI